MAMAAGVAMEAMAFLAARAAQVVPEGELLQADEEGRAVQVATQADPQR